MSADPPPTVIETPASPAGDGRGGAPPPARWWRRATPEGGRGRGRAGVLREFVIVLAGVLGALAAQAWWERTEERGRERDYLRQLLADTRENERRVASALAKDSAAAQAIARLAGALYEPDSRVPTAELARQFDGRAFSSSDFQPLTGTYGALLATGDLRLIRSDSLRAQLVAYTAMLQHEQNMLRFFLEQAFGDPARVGRSLPFLRRMVFAGGGASEEDFERLRRDRGAEGEFFALQVANANRLSHLRNLHTETRRLRAALEAAHR